MYKAHSVLKVRVRAIWFILLLICLAFNLLLLCTTSLPLSSSRLGRNKSRASDWMDEKVKIRLPEQWCRITSSKESPGAVTCTHTRSQHTIHTWRNLDFTSYRCRICLLLMVFSKYRVPLGITCSTLKLKSIASRFPIYSPILLNECRTQPIFFFYLACGSFFHLMFARMSTEFAGKHLQSYRNWKTIHFCS